MDFDYPTSLEEEEPEKPPEPKPAPAPAPFQGGQENGPVAAATGAAATGATVAASTAGKPTPVINRNLKPGLPKSPSQGVMPSSTGTVGPRPAQSAGESRPAANSGVTSSTGGTPAAVYSKPAAPTGTGDAKPAGAAAIAASAAAVSRPSVPDRATKPQSKTVVPTDEPQSEDLPPPSYDDVQEKDKDDAEQERLMQEHKSKENQARLELERMRHGKAKAENEQLRKEKADMEKRLEEKIAALQTLQVCQIVLI